MSSPGPSTRVLSISIGMRPQPPPTSRICDGCGQRHYRGCCFRQPNSRRRSRMAPSTTGRPLPRRQSPSRCPETQLRSFKEYGSGGVRPEPFSSA